MPKISSLPADTSIASTDLITTAKASGTQKNKKVTMSTFKSYMDSGTIVDIVRDYAASTSSADNTTVIQAAANAVPAGVHFVSHMEPSPLMR